MFDLQWYCYPGDNNKNADIVDSPLRKKLMSLVTVQYCGNKLFMFYKLLINSIQDVSILIESKLPTASHHERNPSLSQTKAPQRFIIYH